MGTGVIAGTPTEAPDAAAEGAADAPEAGAWAWTGTLVREMMTGSRAAAATRESEARDSKIGSFVFCGAKGFWAVDAR